MKSLVQTIMLSGESGHPLPDITPSLTQAGVRLRRGQVTMIAAAPGNMKTLLALWYVAQHNLPTLFFSADTDASTIVNRVGAMLTGDEVDTVEAGISGGGTEYYTDQVNSLKNIRWCFDPSPTLDDIDLETMAFTEMWGCPPEIIVIDSLYNVVAEHLDEYAGMREISRALHHVARSTEAGIILLHHVSENTSNAGECPPRKAILGKVSQLPEVILTLAYDELARELKVATVKNRSGPADAQARVHVSLFVDAPRMQIQDAISVPAPQQPAYQDMSPAIQEFWDNIV